ncbi:MAG: 4Fe-4S dicluster domain-containing protein, partial [Peptococcaceae bacterium]|nr:4Fe-4S dicluster domain-containing protein [Peptococcaceae bacterium]
MDQSELQELEAKCTQENPPACSAACPLHVDVRAFMAKAKTGDFQEALAVLQKKEPFPGIIGRICDHPCEATCKRCEVGTALAIADLERFCVQNFQVRPTKAKVIPKKSQKVAVVGGGLSGLTAALDLAKKGYVVTVFEAGAKLGGQLLGFPADVLPPEVLAAEFASLTGLGVEIRLNAEVENILSLPELLTQFDAIYLGTGAKSSATFGLDVTPQGRVAINPLTYITSNSAVFAGGSMRTGEFSPIYSASDGRRAAISIDRYLQGSSLTAARESEGTIPTKLFVNVTGLEPLPRVAIRDSNQGYTPEAASEEAARCLDCQCLECVKACEFMKHYEGYPKKYLRQIYNNESIVMGTRHANKMINSCSLCGLCGEICPQELNLGPTCQTTRQSMVERGNMPPSAHDFALRDMAFSNSEHFALARHQPGHATSKYLFFPGCQLSASSPEQVEKVYAYLRENLAGGVGLML